MQLAVQDQCEAVPDTESNAPTAPAKAPASTMDGITSSTSASDAQPANIAYEAGCAYKLRFGLRHASKAKAPRATTVPAMVSTNLPS